MKFSRIILSVSFALFASSAHAQFDVDSGGTGCAGLKTRAQLTSSFDVGAICTVTDGNAAAGDCTTVGTDKITCRHDGADVWTVVGGSAGGGDVFKTIDTPSGTDPVADGVADTLTLLAGAGCTITGDATADSVTISCPGDGTGYTQEQVEDLVGNMVDDPTENCISVTYDDTNGNLEFDVSVSDSCITGVNISKLIGVNAGTNLANDLEEESHASEHQEGGADELPCNTIMGCQAEGTHAYYSGVTVAECDGTAGKCYDEFSCNSDAIDTTDQGVCMGGTVEGNRCDVNADCSGGSTCTPGDIYRRGISCDGRWEQRNPDGTITRYVTTDDLPGITPCDPGMSYVGAECKDAFTQEEWDAAWLAELNLASGSTIGGNDICYPGAPNCDTTCNDAGVVCLFAASGSEGGNASNADALEGVDFGTMTDTKVCTYDLAGTEVDCATTMATECSSSSCSLNAATTLGGSTICTAGNSGDGNCTDGGGAGSTALDAIGDPTADSAVDLTTFNWQLNWTTPNDTDGAFRIKSSGAFTGTLMQVESGGAPGGSTDIFVVKANNASPNLIRTVTAGSGAVATIPIIMDFESTSPAINDTVRILARAWNASSALEDMGTIRWRWDNVTATTEESTFEVWVDVASTQTKVLEADDVELKIPGYFESTVATGTAPAVVASTTKVTNLNADRWDDTSLDATPTDDKACVIDTTPDPDVINCDTTLFTAADVPAAETDAAHDTCAEISGCVVGADPSSTNELEVEDATTPLTGWNADTTHAPSENDLYDLLITGDTDLDGKANKLDTTSNGFCTTSGGDGSIGVTAANAGTDITADLEEDVHCSEHDGTGVSCNSEQLNTASGEQGFLASGALTCGASTNGKMQVHTTPLQYCDNAATPALQYAAYANSSGDATGIAANTVVAADMGNSDHGDVSWTSNVATVENVQCSTCIGPTELASTDFGSYTCNGTTCSVDSAAITEAMLATADFGSFSCGAGAGDCTVDDTAITEAKLASEDYGSFTCGAGADDCNLDAAVGGRSLTTTSGNLDADVELYTREKCMTIDTPASTDDWLFFRVKAVGTTTTWTVTGINCLAIGGTSAVVTVNECDNNGATCSGLDGATTLTCLAGDDVYDDGSLSNATIDDLDVIRVDVGTVTGSVTQLQVCVNYTVTD